MPVDRISIEAASMAGGQFADDPAALVKDALPAHMAAKFPDKMTMLGAEFAAGGSPWIDQRKTGKTAVTVNIFGVDRVTESLAKMQRQMDQRVRQCIRESLTRTARMHAAEQCRRYTIIRPGQSVCAGCGQPGSAHVLWFAWAAMTPFSRRAALNHTVPLGWQARQALTPEQQRIADTIARANGRAAERQDAGIRSAFQMGHGEVAQ